MTDDNHAEYEEHKKRFLSRNVIEEVQPYVDHIELYLGLINPAYCAEIQRSLVDKTLGNCTSPYAAVNSKVKFVWQTTDDLCDTINGEKVPNILAAKALYGTLEENMRELALLNARGANICIAVNDVEGSRRLNTNVIAARAIWCEDDSVVTSPKSPKDFPLPYSFVVESSKGKYHYYWLTYTEDLKTWQRIQREVMVPLFGSDPGANGLNRAMRIPGFWHKKKNKFATRIVYLLGNDNVPLDAVPSATFLDIGIKNKGREEYAFNSEDCSDVRRYDWEEIELAFASLLTNQESTSETNVNYLATFDPVNTMHQVVSGEDYHSSLHALCMHFANYQQDVDYVTNVVQSIMCRVPEAQRDKRWNARFNDVKRSAKAAVNKKLEELTNETLYSSAEIKASIDTDISIHNSSWVVPFPDISGACIPLDMMMAEFSHVIKRPIKSFNFATILSFFCACIQNIPVMPAMGERKANGCHLLLAPSTGGKDINMSGPLRALARTLIQSGYISPTDMRSNAILSSFAFMNSEITSLAAFHRWAADDVREYGAVWSNTECTSIINKMSDENSNVSNLSELVISIQDGIPIPAVHKAVKKEDGGGSVPLIEAYSLLFATQPGSVQKHMNSRLLYKGVIGRFDYYVPSEIQEVDYESTLSVDTLRPYTFSHEVLKFLGYVLTVCSAHINKTSKDVLDGSSRDVVIKYDINDPNPRAPNFDSQMRINGPNRLKHIQWDNETGPKYKSDDHEFNTFIDRVPMSTERYLTILTFMQHLWDSYKANVDPFAEPVVTNPKLIDLVSKLGNYQYDVRANRIWSLIARSKGLDDKHQAMLDAVKEADSRPERWMKYLSHASTAVVYKELYEKERFISISSVTRCLTRDANISTKDSLHICRALSDYGYIEFVAQKKMDVRISDKPVKNVVRLTSQGRA